MKTILLLITVLFSGMAVSSCTNDEADTEFDHLNPDEEQQSKVASLDTETLN